MARIVVVGAGIVGLSTAVCIQEDIDNVQVTLLAELQDIYTTSDGAAGLFHPDHVAADKPSDAEDWIRDSAERYWSECYFNSVGHGVFEVSGYCYSNSDPLLVEDPAFHHYIRNAHRLEGSELDRVGGGPWRYGCFKTTLITEPRIRMPYLFKKFLASGGKLVERKLNSLSELADETWDIVVNCTGLGARNLVNDHSMYPIRGQVMRVRAPWIKHFYCMEDDAYIIPNSELVVVGGTRQKNNWGVDVSAEDREAFLERCSRMTPSIRQAATVREWVGLRPGRPTVRVELELLPLSRDRSVPVFHNYGHGGNGIALSWGCGKHVARLVKEHLEHHSAAPRFMGLAT